MNGQCFLFCLHASSLFSSTRQFEYYNVVTLEILEYDKSDFPLSQGLLLLLAAGCICLFNNFFSLVYSCFPALYWFLLYSKVNQLYVFICPLFFGGFFTFLFIYFWLCWILLLHMGSLVVASYCGRFSCWGAQALGCTGLVALGLGSCGTPA